MSSSITTLAFSTYSFLSLVCIFMKEYTLFICLYFPKWLWNVKPLYEFEMASLDLYWSYVTVAGVTDKYHRAGEGRKISSQLSSTEKSKRLRNVWWNMMLQSYCSCTCKLEVTRSIWWWRVRRQRHSSSLKGNNRNFKKYQITLHFLL